MRVSKAYDAMLKGTPRPMSADLWYICRIHTNAALKLHRHDMGWGRSCPVVITKGVLTAGTRLTDTLSKYVTPSLTWHESSPFAT